jgi:hypothetical protein
VNRLLATSEGWQCVVFTNTLGVWFARTDPPTAVDVLPNLISDICSKEIAGTPSVSLILETVKPVLSNCGKRVCVERMCGLLEV